MPVASSSALLLPPAVAPKSPKPSPPPPPSSVLTFSPNIADAGRHQHARQPLRFAEKAYNNFMAINLIGLVTAAVFVGVCVVVAAAATTTTANLFARADYIPHHYRHNFSCIDWWQAPEAAAGNCTRYGPYGALRCYGGINNLPQISEQKLRKLEEIILCGWPELNFDPNDDLLAFPRIKALIIEYSSLTEIMTDFPEMVQLQSINISWTNLSHINSRTFKRVHTLKVLDLRWNQLKQLDALVLPPDTALYLAGNPWNCTRNLKWVATPEKGDHVVDREEVICTDRKYKERSMYIVMNYKLILRRECQSHEDIRNCTCLMHHIIPKSHIPLYTVNCSNLQLQRLPAFLPENTTMFFANGNEITDVLPLRNNLFYRQVVDVHLDHNRIETIDVLEGSYWLDNFRLLSLRGNRLRKIPVYALDNALDDNANANLLLLSQNPWYCSCIFAMRFREIIIKYNSILRDAWNITCTYKVNDEDHFRRSAVLSITRQDVCRTEQEHPPHVYPLDILNCVLAALIVLTLAKLAYDYYYYKNYGRVPWIVMKLP